MDWLNANEVFLILNAIHSRLHNISEYIIFNWNYNSYNRRCLRDFFIGRFNQYGCLINTNTSIYIHAIHIHIVDLWIATFKSEVHEEAPWSEYYLYQLYVVRQPGRHCLLRQGMLREPDCLAIAPHVRVTANGIPHLRKCQITHGNGAATQHLETRLAVEGDEEILAH